MLGKKLVILLDIGCEPCIMPLSLRPETFDFDQDGVGEHKGVKKAGK